MLERNCSESRYVGSYARHLDRTGSLSRTVFAGGTNIKHREEDSSRRKYRI
jgi:hypothetical protein